MLNNFTIGNFILNNTLALSPEIEKDIINNSLPFFIFNEYAFIGGICSAIALILATHQIIMHLYFFNEPKLQLFIVRILLMVPVSKI